MSSVTLQQRASAILDSVSEFETFVDLDYLDEEIPVVPLHRVLRLNAKEWWIIILGLLGAAVSGSIWPVFSIFISEIVALFSNPADEILGETHLWASLFIVLGVCSGVGTFAKVSSYMVLKSSQYNQTRA